MGREEFLLEVEEEGEGDTTAEFGLGDAEIDEGRRGGWFAGGVIVGRGGARW